MSVGTRLTKTGQPVMGTTIEVALTDGTYERAKVVGKGFGHDGHTLVMLMVEWEDGVRQPLGPPLDAEDWRSVIAAPSSAPPSVRTSTRRTDEHVSRP